LTCSQPGTRPSRSASRRWKRWIFSSWEEIVLRPSDRMWMRISRKVGVEPPRGDLFLAGDAAPSGLSRYRRNDEPQLFLRAERRLLNSRLPCFAACPSRRAALERAV
jgi:hypothetical protein